MLLSGEQNRLLLTNVLADRYTIISGVDGLDSGPPEGPFDLCMIDSRSLVLHRQWLTALRRNLDPIYLPVLLLAEKSDTGRMSPSLWEVTDDVLLRPVDRIELTTRVQSLLRTRAMSLRAQRMFGLYEQEARIARRLQTAALPNAFPQLPDVHFSGFYQPADVDAKVGGDWYDVLRLVDGRIVVSVGDVAGSGLDAAVTMGKLRQAVRAVAQLHTDPANILEAMDQALQSDEPGRYVTAFLGVIDTIEERFDYASAGHPMPIMRRPDGTLHPFADADLLLGTGIRTQRRSHSIACERGSILVFYTDGLTEATRNVIEGQERLEQAVRTIRADQFPNAAQAIFNDVVTDTANDDTAVLVIDIAINAHTPALATYTFDSSDIERVRTVQAAITRRLEEAGHDVDTIAACELAFIELVGNVVRYASGEVQVVLDTTHAVSILHVLDRGPGFVYVKSDPADISDTRYECGRGLYIIATLAERFFISPRFGGGSHARAVLPVRVQ